MKLKDLRKKIRERESDVIYIDEPIELEDNETFDGANYGNLTIVFVDKKDRLLNKK